MNLIFVLGFMPLPAPLLDDTKYRTATTHLMCHSVTQQNCHTVTNRSNRPYSSGMLLGTQNQYIRGGHNSTYLAICKTFDSLL